MIISITTILLILILLFVIFWIASLTLAQAIGAPSVYANNEAINDAFKLAKLKRGQLVLDLGCGDGRSLIIAAKKYGAKAVGIERSLYCFLFCKIRVQMSGYGKNIKVIFGDFHKAEQYLIKVDLVYLYLLNKILNKEEDWLFLSLKKEASISSLCFEFKKHTPAETMKTQNLGKQTTIYLYRKQLSN